MVNKVYISNISPLWPEQRQAQVCEQAGPEAQWFKDELDSRDRRAQRAAGLTNRAQLLRPTTRQAPDRLYVAALPCLAFDTEDFLEVLKAAAARNLTVVALTEKLTFSPSQHSGTLNKAAAAFVEAAAAARAFSRGQLGGTASGAKRQAQTAAAAKLIEKDWGNPAVTNAALVKRAGRSINSLKNVLGDRRAAVRAWKAEEKRKATRERSKCRTIKQ